MAIHISRKQSLLMAAGIVSLFVLSGVFLLKTQPTLEETYSATDKESQPQGSSTEEPEPEKKNVVVLKKFQRSQIKDGKPVWDIEAIKGRHVPEDKQSFLESPKLTIYNEDGSTTKVNSRSATLYHSEDGIERAELFEQVAVAVSQKMTLETEQATFFAKEQKVTAPGKVLIEASGFTVKGTELQGDLNSNTFTILQDVDTVIKPTK